MPGTYDTGRKGTRTFTGETTGTGAAIAVTVGFAPACVLLVNKTQEALCFWNREMLDGEGQKMTGLVSGTYTATGSEAHAFSLYDIKGSANTDSENADAASAPTNSDYVSADATVTGGAWTKGAITSPDVARNVCIVIENPTGGALNLFEGVMTFTVSGSLSGGGSTTETITFTSSAGNKSMAAAKFRYKYGTKDFRTVTDITLDNVPANALVISAGLGSKIALLTTVYSSDEANILRAAINTTNYAFTGKYDTTRNTLNYGALSDGDDVHASFYAISGNAGTITSNSTNIDYLSSNGITPTQTGFTIGSNAGINTLADTIYWTAWPL